MTSFAWRFGLVCTLMAWLAGCESDPSVPSSPAKVLRLAVTTSTRDSGLLDALLPVFERQTGLQVDVIAAGTGKALKLGEGGEVDVVLVHSRPDEDAFIAAGHGVRREDVMFNTFDLLGPPADPAEVRGLPAVEALAAIAVAKQPLASRGDDSGTHKRELALWKRAGGRPAWDGYLESGQGMGRTLIMANQRQAYVLADRGTFLKFRAKLDLVPLARQGEILNNPYGILVVNPAKDARINVAGAHRLVDFFVSRETQQKIRDYRVGGEPLFYPLRLPVEIKSSTASTRQPDATGASFLGDGLRNAVQFVVTFDSAVISAAVRSLWISSLAVLIATGLGLPLGIVLARVEFAGRRAIVVLCRAGMAVPTVFVGIVCFAVFARQGPLGPTELLYTPWVIVLGEVLLGLPIVISITQGAVRSLDPRVAETAITLGAGRFRRWSTYLSEARLGVMLGVLTAFARCVTELGIPMMVGGNIAGRTRTLATATAMETGKGEFARGLAMGFLLLMIALAVTAVIGWVGREERT